MLHDLIPEPFFGFDKKTLDFLKKLKNKKYNNKIWFDAHRDEYLTLLKEPMKLLVNQLAVQLKRIDKDLVLNEKSILRINRDIRFSKDKTPYKSYYAAAYTYQNRDDSVPHFYFHISSDEFLFASGMYSVETTKIKKIRNKIYEEQNKFISLVTDNDFKKYFPKLEGQKLVNLPKVFNPDKVDSRLIEVLKHKQFYVYKTFPPNLVLKDDFVDLLFKLTSITNNFNKFLYNS